MKVAAHQDVDAFIAALDEPTIAKTLRTIDLLERFGSALRFPHSKSVAKGLFELRVRGRQEVRILYTFHGNVAVLLHGFIKKSTAIPPKDMHIGIRRMRNLT